MTGNGAYKTLTVDEMVDRGSRHRDRFSSQETPAGYYRADMQDSLEEQEYKAQQEQARELEAKKRFNEAIRCGKWKFRDKKLRDRVLKIYQKRN
ncbi:hypothetical protein AWJ20_848 [Sugiyamaella lignohabitans]|uniref:DNA endonuclease activator Ctp1 C-terminal domain-containing protein n=1 Tax=Sugiyamaella lignohabitans TaxID=796027 RepID=A0A167D802_9ASCO|nr:uncharacterized protein AWJ20_848 [Sugiyamaella lignohabitans]ANB12591.1 hypothetical protein AWJ20_848 [Sugiyamaella lignohabitans]